MGITYYGKIKKENGKVVKDIRVNQTAKDLSDEGCKKLLQAIFGGLQ